MKNLKLVNGLWVAVLGLSFATVSCKREGCTDPAATNYEKRANDDDGSCVYGPGEGPADGETQELTEDINTPTTLVAGNYKVCSTIDVNAALTINPGVTITFCATEGLSVGSDGSITAVGTAAQPIVFQGESESPGYWAGVAIYSNNPNNRMEYVTVKSGGSYWAWDYANIYLGSGAKLVLKNSTSNGSEGNGLYAESNASLPSFSGNSFANNSLAGVNIGAVQAGSLDAASSYNISNGEAVVTVRGGTIGTPQTWNALGTPYLITSTVDVNAALTLNPGVEILLGSGEGIDVNDSGSLTAVGTAAQPIKIEGQFASAGYGAGVNIGSNNPNNKFNYVNMAHLGSYWAWDHSGIHVAGRLEIDNSYITNSNSWALYVESSSVIISNGATQTTPAGVMVTNTFTANGAGADADCVGGGCTVYFN